MASPAAAPELPRGFRSEFLDVRQTDNAIRTPE
jgi:hypothetical protein